MLSKNELPLFWLLGFVCGVVLMTLAASATRTAERHSAIAAQAGAYDARTGEFIYKCGKEAR